MNQPDIDLLDILHTAWEIDDDQDTAKEIHSEYVKIYPRARVGNVISALNRLIQHKYVERLQIKSKSRMDRIETHYRITVQGRAFHYRYFEKDWSIEAEVRAIQYVSGASL